MKIQKILRSYWPELVLAAVFLLCAAAATWQHCTLGFPIFMLARIENPESNWDLFWMAGSVGSRIPHQWWFGLGYSWWILFAWPLLTYGTFRVIWLTWRLTGIPLKRTLRSRAGAPSP